MKFKTSFLVMLLSTVCSLVEAHDFSVTMNGQKIYFNISSRQNRTAEVTYCGSIKDKKPSYYEGELSVPEKVRHENIVYSVVGIKAKAFSGADKLTSVILPSGLKYIGDFAFEGCTSLGKVIFPGNPVKFGEGVFFRCDKLKDISFGSDWTEVNLKMFRWSDSLVTVTIPAKMEQIRNMKSLKHLHSIHVDVNNVRFTDVDGVLYNKSKETLYGCPRGFQGRLRIAEGLKTIMPEALADCVEVTEIDFPASLESLPFRELGRMEKLTKIIFRGDKPVMTAMNAGREVFSLQLAAPKVKVEVPKKSCKLYRKAVAGGAGDYTGLNADVPYEMDASVMMQPKNIVGVKKFTDK